MSKFKQILLSFILFLCSIHVPAQQKKIDSLEKLLFLLDKKPASYTVDTTKIELLNAIVWQMTNFKSRLDTAMIYAKQALALSEKIKWNKGRANSYSTIARVYKSRREQGQAIVYYRKALEILKEIGDKNWISSCLYFMGQTYFDQGNYPLALDHLLESLRISEEAANKDNIARNLTFIGNVYAEIGDNEHALTYYLQALKKNEELKNKFWTAINLQSIAAIYNYENNYDSSLDYYSRVLQMTSGNVYSTYMIYKDIGDVYRNRSSAGIDRDSSWNRAMDHYSKAIKTATEINDSLTLGAALSGMGGLYLQRNKTAEAGEALYRSLGLLKNFNRPEYLKDCYYYLSVLDSLKGDWKNAFEHFRLYTIANDSMFNKKKNRQMTQAQIKYETGKKQAEIEILNKDNELKNLKIKEQQKNIILIIAGAALLLLAAGGMLYYRGKRIRRQALKQISEAKLASLKSLMDKHFIFSSLHSIDTFLMNNDAGAASDYLVKYSKLIRMILEMSTQAEVSLDEEIILCKSYLDLEKIRYTQGFDYEISIDPGIHSQQTQFPSMLLQPLVENAVKHGIGSLIEGEGRKRGMISISINKMKDKLVCTVTDNGKGLGFTSGTTAARDHRSYSGKGIIERVRVYNNLSKNKASFLLKDNDPGVSAILTLPFIFRKQSVAI